MWNAPVDEMVPSTSYGPTAPQPHSLGYRHELDVFAPSDHLTLAIKDRYAPAAAFLPDTQVGAVTLTGRNLPTPLALTSQYRTGARWRASRAPGAST